MLEKLVLEVGRREIDDIQKVSIEGAIVRPDRNTDIAIILVPGINTRWEHYMSDFSLEIGKIWPVYTTNLRRKGFTSGETVVRDLAQIDEQMRDRFETDRIVYFGHSMGLPLGVEAARIHERQILGYLGMTTYPSLGDRFNSSPNTSENNSVQSLADRIALATNFAPFAYPLNQSDIDAPVLFVIGENDWVTGTSSSNVRERFQNQFERFPNGISITIPGNHWFNHGLRIASYNQDNREALITTAKSFLQQLT